jgi:hydroxymethylglutaryl-CoA reductase
LKKLSLPEQNLFILDDKFSVSGFSKLSKNEKVDWIARTYFAEPAKAAALLKSYWHPDPQTQQLHDEFIENTVTNFFLPLGIAPNFLINGKYYTLPMAVEESSVVAAASKSAKFWASRGGFWAEIVGTEKIGQVHFIYKGDAEKLRSFFDATRPKLIASTDDLTRNMRNRGGGLKTLELRDKTSEMPDYFQLHATFDTKDSMGANFINSCLERLAKTLVSEAEIFEGFDAGEREMRVVMSILSNYVPNCLVRASVCCKVADLADNHIADPQAFAEKFVQAVRIAEIEPFRAVTHNKGIMNGVDAVVVATGNDFRAVEAGVHAFAARDGKYRSLSHAKIENGIFTFWMDIPLALGTVGGLTSLHPLVKFALQMLERPSATQLMEIAAVAGLAQNFAALRSLTTTGIQEGHMKMHLNNIMNQFEASKEERQQVREHFNSRPVSHAAVADVLNAIRNI